MCSNTWSRQSSPCPVDQLQPKTTKVVLHTPETDTYCTAQVAQVGEWTVDLLFTVEVPVRVTFSVQPDKTLTDPMGRPVKVFEYLGQP